MPFSQRCINIVAFVSQIDGYVCSSARNNPIATKISGDFGYIFSFAFRKYGLDTISRSTRKSTIWYYQNMNYPDFDRIACAILFLISRLRLGNANRVGMNTVVYSKIGKRSTPRILTGSIESSDNIVENRLPIQLGSHKCTCADPESFSQIYGTRAELWPKPF